MQAYFISTISELHSFRAAYELISNLLASSLNIALNHRIIFLSESLPAYSAPDRVMTLCQSRETIQHLLSRTSTSLSNLLEHNVLTLLPNNM